MASFDSMLTYLKKVDPALGKSTYQHLIELLIKIIKEKPNNALQLFEKYSVELKNNNNTQQKKGGYQNLSANEKKQILTTIQSNLNFIQPPPKNDEEEDDKRGGVNEELLASLPDIDHYAYLLEIAGISFGKQAWFELSLSLATLASSEAGEGFDSWRIWGKLLGTEKDYYIIEAKSESIEQPDEAQEEEIRAAKMEWGTGANEYYYFISNSSQGPFTRLPPVLPEQIELSRSIRRFLTGNLQAPVLGFPRFPWPEASLVRAIIARISSGTIVSPKGALLLEGDEREGAVPIPNEEWRGRYVSELQSSSRWVHSRMHLMRDGRCEAEEGEGDEEEIDENDKKAVEEKAKRDAEKEKKVPYLRSLDEDHYEIRSSSALNNSDVKIQKSGEGGGCWSFRYAPKLDFPPTKQKDLSHLSAEEKQRRMDDEEEENKRNHSTALSHSIAIAQSLLWPGAISIAKNKEYFSFYVGWGLKQLSKPYRPPSPPLPLTEFRPLFDATKGEKNPLKELDDPKAPTPGSQTEENGDDDEENKEDKDDIDDEQLDDAHDDE